MSFCSLQVIWVVTFLAAVFLGLDIGLATAVAFELLTVVIRSQLWVLRRGDKTSQGLLLQINSPCAEKTSKYVWANQSCAEIPECWILFQGLCLSVEHGTTIDRQCWALGEAEWWWPAFACLRNNISVFTGAANLSGNIHWGAQKYLASGVCEEGNAYSSVHAGHHQKIG